MSKGLFITGTDTDIGKTYVTALLVKTMRQNGYDNCPCCVLGFIDL